MTPATLQAISQALVVLAAVAGGIAAIAGLVGTLLANRAADMTQKAADVRIAAANSVAEVAKSDAATANEGAEQAKAVAAGATAVAAQANLKTAELTEENTRLQLQLAQERTARGAMLEQLKPRNLTTDSFTKLVEGVRGKITRITVYTLADTESQMFAFQLIDAFQKAGIDTGWIGSVEQVFRVQGVGMTGMTVVEQPPHGEDTEGRRLFEALIEAGHYPALYTPPLPVANVDGPALFVGKQQPPFFTMAPYQMPPELKKRRPAWDPAMVSPGPAKKRER